MKLSYTCTCETATIIKVIHYEIVEKYSMNNIRRTSFLMRMSDKYIIFIAQSVTVAYGLTWIN